MSREIEHSESAWTRLLPWARALLAWAALGSGILIPPPPPVWVLWVSGGFLAAGGFLLVRRRTPGGAFALLVLFVDLVFFLIVERFEIGALFWLPAIYYLYLMAEAVALYNPQEVLVVAAVSGVFSILVRPTVTFAMRHTTLTAGILGYGMALYKRRAETKIAELEAGAIATRNLAERSREEERQRIASDFHDGPLQSFISLQMRLEILRRLLERDIAAGMLDLHELQALAQQQVKELRAFIRGMRPPDLGGATLYASARRVCEDFQKESGIPVTFVGAEGQLKLPNEAAAEVIQMLREALHNVLKHAGATRVAVSMERTARVLELSVDDNGAGFQFSGVYSLDELEMLRLGPASLKRRARALGADLSLESRPGQGAGLKLRIPIP